MIAFRLPDTRAVILQLIADAETGGNISELLRSLAEKKIDERLRRKERVA